MKNYRYLLLMLFGASFAFNRVSVASEDGIAEKACVAAFAKEGNLKTYTGQKNFKCAFCNKSFARKDVLTAHTRTHTGEKPFKCAIEGCGAVFAQEGNLTAHTRTHTGEKPFKCTFEGCSAVFARDFALKRHVLIHGKNCNLALSSCPPEINEDGPNQITDNDNFSFSREIVGAEIGTEQPEALLTLAAVLCNPQASRSKKSKLHTCPYEGCSANFTADSSLAIHIRKHTGQKPYKCTKCETIFSQKGSLNRHIKRHENKKPCKCTFAGCSAAFTRNEALSNHILCAHTNT